MATDNMTLFESINKLREEIQKRNLKVAAGLDRQLQTAAEYLTDKQSLDIASLKSKWDNRFEEFYQSMIVSDRLTKAILPLLEHCKMQALLKDVLAGDLTEQAEPDQAKDKFFELELASLLTTAGFQVNLDEPDIVVSGNGLAAPFGIACKYPSSEKQIHAHLNKGYKQIARQRINGCVAIGLDQILFQGFKTFKDFRGGSRPPQNVLIDILDKRIVELAKERSEKFPAEHPLDAGLLFVTAGGIYGEPANLTVARAASLLVSSKNHEAYKEMSLIRDALGLA